MAGISRLGILYGHTTPIWIKSLNPLIWKHNISKNDFAPGALIIPYKSGGSKGAMPAKRIRPF